MGAVLVDGRWQPTERSIQVAAERLLQYREHNRIRHRDMREILRKERPELFTRGPRQTLLAEEVLPARSNERYGDLTRYQRDNSSTTAAAATAPRLLGSHSEPERACA